MSNEVATHFLDPTGLVGDTIYLTYTIDYHVESTNFGQMKAEHCPQNAADIIWQARESHGEGYH